MTPSAAAELAAVIEEAVRRPLDQLTDTEAHDVADHLRVISDGAGEIGWTLPDGNIGRLNSLTWAYSRGRWPLVIAG